MWSSTDSEGTYNSQNNEPPQIIKSPSDELQSLKEATKGLCCNCDNTNNQQVADLQGKLAKMEADFKEKDSSIAALSSLLKRQSINAGLYGI